MACYDEFPRSTVRYNAVTLGGATLIGLVIVAQFGPWAAIGYLSLLAFAAVGLLATVCARCGYYGHRCALGIGRLIPLLFKKGQEDEFAGTASQLFSTGLLVLLLIVPVAGGVTLLVRGWAVWRLLQLVALVGLLLAGLVPHPRLVCRHCRQRERGACPIGCLLWRAGE
jgi:hypothetical protein